MPKPPLPSPAAPEIASLAPDAPSRAPPPVVGLRPRDLHVEDLPGMVRRGQRLLGLDLGEKTVGIAMSDVEWRIASAMTTIRRRKFRDDAAELLALVDRFDVGALVIGLPLNMDGSSGPRVQATRGFARNLGAQRAIPILFWDERLSTVAAERAMLAADMSRAKRAAAIDAAAAAFILQGVLDALRARARRDAGDDAAPPPA